MRSAPKNFQKKLLKILVNCRLKGAKVRFDSSILPQERKDYLAGIVNFTDFVENTENLSDCVYYYLKEVEWRDMQVESNEKMLEEKIINVAFDSIFKNNI